MNDNLRKAMDEKKLTVKSLAFRLDLSSGYLSAVLCGFYRSKKTRRRVADALGKSEAYLWPGDKIQ